MNMNQAQLLASADYNGLVLRRIHGPVITADDERDHTKQWGWDVAVCGDKCTYNTDHKVDVALKSIRATLERRGAPWVIEKNPMWAPESAFAVY